GKDLLTGVGGDEAEELLRRLRCVGGHRARILDLDRRVRYDVVDVGTALPCGNGLVLVRDQHVTGAAGEGARRLPPARGQAHDVGVVAGQIVDRALLRAPLGGD